MPKRVGKATASFLRGFNAGRNLTELSMHFFALMSERAQTAEEFANNCGVPVSFIEGIICCSMETYLKSSIDYYTAVAKYCDIAFDVRIKSVLQVLNEHVTLAPPKSFEEEAKEIDSNEPKLGKETFIEFNDAISFDIPGKGIVYVTTAPFDSVDYEYLINRSVMINGNERFVTNVEFGKGVIGLCKAGSPIGLIVRNLVDNPIPKIKMMDLIPLINEKNVNSFVKPDKVQPYLVDINCNNIVHKFMSAPLVIGKTIDLLALSEHPVLLKERVQDLTDHLDTHVVLSNLYILSHANGVEKVHKVDTHNMPTAVASLPVGNNYRYLTLNFENNDLGVHVFGAFNLETGTIRLDASVSEDISIFAKYLNSENPEYFQFITVLGYTLTTKRVMKQQ